MLLELQLPCSTKATTHCTHRETHTRAPAAKNDHGWEKNGAITHKQIKQNHMCTNIDKPLTWCCYMCVQMGSSWGLTDIAMGYSSVEFVFLSLPSIPRFFKPVSCTPYTPPVPLLPPIHSFDCSHLSSSSLSLYPSFLYFLGTTSQVSLQISLQLIVRTQHGHCFSKSGLCCIQAGNIYLIFGR